MTRRKFLKLLAGISTAIFSFNIACFFDTERDNPYDPKGNYAYENNSLNYGYGYGYGYGIYDSNNKNNYYQKNQKNKSGFYRLSRSFFEKLTNIKV